MSPTAASAVAATSQSTSQCAARLYDIPVQVASCAMPYGGNHTTIMSACCGSASVISYYNDCGLFCIAEGQTVKKLTECLFDHGAGYADVFCRGQVTAEATAGATVAASAHAHVVAATASPAQSSSAVDSSSSSTSDGGAKHDLRGAKIGLAIGALLLFSALVL